MYLSIIKWNDQHLTSFKVINLEKLGSVWNFQTQVEINSISLPMKDINKLQERSKTNRVWAVNNSTMMTNEPESTEELTETDIKIFKF